MSFEAGLWYSLLHRETGGTKDVKNATITGYQESVLEVAQSGVVYDRDLYVSDLTAVDNAAPNPTRVYNVVVRNTGTSPITINPGTTRTMRTDSVVYDCTTRIRMYKLNGQIHYGYKESVKGTVSKVTESKTVLAQAGSTAMQNFAFDIDEFDIDE